MKKTVAYLLILVMTAVSALALASCGLNDIEPAYTPEQSSAELTGIDCTDYANPDNPHNYGGALPESGGTSAIGIDCTDPAHGHGSFIGGTGNCCPDVIEPGDDPDNTPGVTTNMTTNASPVVLPELVGNSWARLAKNGEDVEVCTVLVCNHATNSNGEELIADGYGIFFSIPTLVDKYKDEIPTIAFNRATDRLASDFGGDSEMRFNGIYDSEMMRLECAIDGIADLDDGKYLVVMYETSKSISTDANNVSWYNETSNYHFVYVDVK